MAKGRKRHQGPVVGIIANPVSARDIRRVIANATALQITDRANIVLRVLSCLKSCGVSKVFMMPENGGIRHHVRRGIDRAENQGHEQFPVLEHLDYKISGRVDDTIKAARLMQEMGVEQVWAAVARALEGEPSLQPGMGSPGIDAGVALWPGDALPYR